MLASGVATFAPPEAYATPMVFNDAFTLSTSNQSAYGSGAQQGFSYDSGFLGTQWGKYVDGVAVTAGVSEFVGYKVDVPRFCAWTPWGDLCTPSFSVDTRTGAGLKLETSGRLGTQITASATGAGVSVVLPVKTQLQIGDAVNGRFRVGGNATIDAAQGGARISATAPSFNAAVNAFVNVNAGVAVTGCIVGLCGGDAVALSYDLIKDNTLAAVSLGPDNSSLTVVGTQVDFPGVNQYYEIRSGGVGSKIPSLQGDTFRVGGPILAQVKVDTLQDFSGDTVSNNTLSLSQEAQVFHLNADVTGLAQKFLGLPVDILNPKFSLKPPYLPALASLEGTFFDHAVGIVLGLKQSYEVKPNLQVTLEFDKPVTEYVKIVDYKEVVFDHRKYEISFDNAVAAARYNHQDPLKSIGCIHGFFGDNNDQPKVEQCFVQTLERTVRCLSTNEFCDMPSQFILLRPEEAFRLDQPYYVWQCRTVDVPPLPWGDAGSHDIKCLQPAVIATREDVYFKEGTVDRGRFVTVDLNSGADLRFTGDAGNLIGRTFTMDDEQNFRSKASITINSERLLRAGCFEVHLGTIGYDAGCLFSYTDTFQALGGLNDILDLRIPQGSLDVGNVFDRSFALGGFNSVAFGADVPMPPTPPPGVPEPSTLWLALLGLLGLGRAARRPSRTV